ncbi:MAG: acetyltransferase-like isoleucine patch superfamily enzyme [Thalassolituus sp.]|jgi:acetyltransferase-like isoleucine patch superfamily enzyme
MPNKLAGRFLSRYIRIHRHIKQILFDSVIFYEVSELARPFDIHSDCELRTPHQIRIEPGCAIKARAILNGRSRTRKHGISLGSDTYLKENCYLDAYGGFIEVSGQCAFAQNTIIHGGGGVKIGKNVIFGANCYIISSNHKFRSRELPIILQGDERKGISIGNNVWLGGNVIVLDGVTIGDNCVIGAGSIVRKDIPSNTVVFDSRQSVYKEVFHDRNI